MNEQIADSENKFKRHTAYKLRIGQVMGGRQIFDEEKLKSVEVGARQASRVNLIANIVDKYIQDGEKKFGSLTLDDASGQIKAKVFGDDLVKLEKLEQGDTVLVIGLLRSWNNEVYLTPEIIRKKDPAFLLVRKLEVEADEPKQLAKEEVAELRDKILSLIKGAEENGGIAYEDIEKGVDQPKDSVHSEIKKLLEDGVAYEPRPGKLRYLG